MVEIILGIIIGLAICVIVWLLIRARRHNSTPMPTVEIKEEHIKELTDYVKMQKQAADEAKKIKDLRQADMKQKLEVFKQTKEQLRDRLKTQIDAKTWRPLASVLNSADKGGVGIYIIYNQTKNKYYIGQAKQIFKRIRDHFAVEQIAIDQLAGDVMQVKFLTANELDADYRLDHIEKTGIEIFEADKKGYNKTTGNV